MTKQDHAARLLAGALFLALFFLWGVGYNCFPIFLPSMLKQFHLTRLQVGLVPGVQAITAGVFGLLVGWLLDRVPAQIVMAVGVVLTAVGIVMMSQAGSLNSLLAGSAVTGIGMVASTILPASMVIANWFGERRGTALGITLAGMELGGMVITMLAGYLIVAYGWRFAYAGDSAGRGRRAALLDHRADAPQGGDAKRERGQPGSRRVRLLVAGPGGERGVAHSSVLDAVGIPVLLHVRVRRQLHTSRAVPHRHRLLASSGHDGSQLLAGTGCDRQARDGSAR
jgi:nitrate/nitrite transporter NarK